jgi:uncharacterized protein YqcC (DUF446 family)
VTEYPLGSRAHEPAEQIEMTAHAGECRYCHELVKMRRDDNWVLRPDQCHCLYCGQPYFVVTDDIDEWEYRQWLQKAEQG